MRLWKILNKKKQKDIVKILLENRGIKSKKEVEEFLSPPKPSDLNLKDFEIDKKEIDKAIKRILRAKAKKEKVVVYTDYDADGVCGGTIVWETLHKMGLSVMPYIPKRLEEGYGLSEKGIDKIRQDFNPTLIITVDHGITAADKIKYAQKFKIDTIVIDHHVKSHKSPALALIHTTKLCATGIAWVFVRELIKNADNYLDLVALATIADLVPLLGVNRSLVKYGLEKLNKTKRIGLLALINSAGISIGNIGVYEVGHMLAPRINAMGRLMHALDAMRLLCTKDEQRASSLAHKLSSTNRERQLLTQESLIHAYKLFQTKNQESKLIFLVHESYNQGVIGLIAGRLVEKYYRPAIVIAKGDIYSKASARSISGFNIIETIRQASDMLVDCGGHPMAAGFTVKTDHIEILQKKLETIVETKLKDNLLIHTLKIDSEISLKDINWELYRALQSLEPYGIGNPQPIFAAFGVHEKEARLIGKDSRHLKMKISDANGKEFDTIGFGFGNIFPDLAQNPNLDICYTIEENNWNNHRSLQLKLKDVKMNVEN